MKTINVPTLGARYWTSLCLASVFGANMGDFAAHNLHLGHASGLPPLAALLGIILLKEWRSRSQVGTELYYWLAIVTMRTAATNLGDLATHDFHLDYLWVIAGLALLLALNVSRDPLATGTRDAGAHDLPATNARYWGSMLIAGTLGTAAGDFAADGLGLAVASLFFSALVLALVAFGNRIPLHATIFYWVTIAFVRTAGTNVGDLLAGHEGLHLGLLVSTPLTGALLYLVLQFWKPQPAMRPSLA
ncbi:MAG: hypothetical protein P4M00_03370 [Azospirillaceae bacterium]|nr:hypothetical protein [Azospirillaceae bacterium]